MSTGPSSRSIAAPKAPPARAGREIDALAAAAAAFASSSARRLSKKLADASPRARIGATAARKPSKIGMADDAHG